MTPCLHTPTFDCPQAAPPPGSPSSTVPLQLLSTASHTSEAAGRRPPAHSQPPLRHTRAPAEQGEERLPVPLHVAPGGGSHESWAKVQDVPALFQHPGLAGVSVGLSSMAPLQSLSLPSHTS